MTLHLLDENPVPALRTPGLGIDPRRAYRETPLRDLGERFLALLVIAVASPFLAALALLVKMTSRGPAIYSQIRVGQHGRLIQVHKFRTMVEDAEAATGATLSWDGDPRITRIGGVFRRLYLDELPQLWNVVKGEMSFIGPRPERPVFVDDFVNSVPGYRYRHYVKPGITGLAQISAGYHAKPAEKLRYDLRYIRERDSLVFHVKICVWTLLKILNLNDVEWRLRLLLDEAQQPSLS